MDNYVTLLACILLNALIGVVFKLFKKYEIDTLQAITVNYLVCFCTAALTVGGSPLPELFWTKAWFPYAILMGLLFILIFNLVAKTVAYTGVMIATIFQKMSLVAPALVGILFYHESSGPVKWSGIALALAAIALLSFQKDMSGGEPAATKRLWLFPVLTFIGSCVIDAGLFLVEHYQLASSTDVSFIATIFLTAGLTGLLLQLFNQAAITKLTRSKNWIAGIALGIPNFFSIHLLLVALQYGWEGSRLFPINNTGVLLTSVAVGVLVFHEKLNKLKIAGIGVAILAILLIAAS